MKFFKLLSLASALFLTGCGLNAANPNVKSLAPSEFQTKLSQDSSAYLLDVRRPEEFAAGHLQGARLLNWLDTENFKHEAKNIDKSRTIYIYCRSGRRSSDAARYLGKQGYMVVDLAGGILAWERDGMPVTTVSETE